MGKVVKTFALILIVIMAFTCLSLLIVKPARAQSSDVNDTIIAPPSDSNIPTPAVPDFTVKAVDSSDFSVIISNQPFTPFNVTDAGPVQFLYSIRVGALGAKADSNWTWLYDALGGYPRQSENQTTIITVSLTNGNSQYGEPNPINLTSPFLIEVQAIIGFYGRDSAISPLAPYVIYGEASEWSGAQTVTLPTTSTPTIVTPSPTIVVLELSWSVVVPLLLFLSSAAVVLRHRKNR